MFRHFIGAFIILIYPIGVAGQTLESYVEQKKAKQQKPNSYLTNDAMSSFNQLSRYYRRALGEQRLGQGFTFGPDMSGTSQLPSSKMPMMAALDGAINPDEYRVGPLDMLSINIWADIPSSFTSYVTPEGSVVIPTVGEIDVRNQTLRNAKQRINEEIERKYPKAKATVTLVSPRTFTVHVTGIVGAPGTYEVTAGERADKAIYMANLSKAVKEMEKAKSRTGLDPDRIVSYDNPPESPEPAMSMRSILLLRNGDTLRTDLLRYYATGDLHSNPRLNDGDVLVVPPEQTEANTVSVYGGVKLTGSFEYQPGDSLRLLLRIAQGFKENAIRDTVEVTRFVGDGESFRTIRIGPDILDSPDADFALQPGDRVFVRERRILRREHTVTIRGEVQYTGSYPITKDRTTLSEIISRAGGFTESAAVVEGVIFRKDPNLELDPVRKVADYRRLEEMRLADMDLEEREYYTYETTIRRNTVSADFRRLFIDRDASADITLRDGDEIVIPATLNSVYVYGQVTRPGHVTHVEHMDESYYIERAGGFSESAVKGDIRVIKAGSKAWESAGTSDIGPGDAIFVPRSKDRDFVFYFTALRDFLQITVSVITVYLLFLQINRN